jgi:hypothetical protein
MSLHIIFDGPPSHESGRFVEVENDDGASITIGRWEQRGDLWALIIPYIDPAIVVEACEKMTATLGALKP